MLLSGLRSTIVSISFAGEGSGGSRGEDFWSLESIPFFIKLSLFNSGTYVFKISSILKTWTFLSSVIYILEVKRCLSQIKAPHRRLFLKTPDSVKAQAWRCFLAITRHAASL